MSALGRKADTGRHASKQYVPTMDRRHFLISSGAALLFSSGGSIARTSRSEFAAIEGALGHGGRLGFAALNTATGQSLAYRADERFALCSTFKVALAAAWLARADRGRATLSQLISFSEADLTDYAPVVRANRGVGRLSLERLCAAVVVVSDNAAANLLLKPLGGPPGFTRLLRGWGDTVTRLDRYEELLGTNIRGDARDTTTPRAMLALMQRLLLGDALTSQSREKLIRWMQGATTGLQRLRAGLPSSWRAGDKTGNGRNGAANDLAIAWPPNAPPILIASYMSGGTADRSRRDAGHAALGRVVAQLLGDCPVPRVRPVSVALTRDLGIGRKQT
jgi:beta-lactamase class A